MQPETSRSHKADDSLIILVAPAFTAVVYNKADGVAKTLAATCWAGPWS